MQFSLSVPDLLLMKNLSMRRKLSTLLKEHISNLLLKNFCRALKIASHNFGIKATDKSLVIFAINMSAIVVERRKCGK